MLEFKNVTFQYEGDDLPMMKDLSFSVEDGDFVSIIGASGCGKSTIFRLINGLERLQQGEIAVDGKPDENIQDIRNLAMVVKGGALVRSSIEGDNRPRFNPLPFGQTPEGASFIDW